MLTFALLPYCTAPLHPHCKTLLPHAQTILHRRLIRSPVRPSHWAMILRLTHRPDLKLVRTIEHVAFEKPEVGRTEDSKLAGQPPPGSVSMTNASRLRRNASGRVRELSQLTGDRQSSGMPATSAVSPPRVRRPRPDIRKTGRNNFAPDQDDRRPIHWAPSKASMRRPRINWRRNGDGGRAGGIRDPRSARRWT